MPRRLAYTLSFWLLGAVALSTLAVGGLTAWNLREGFTAYLQARDMERFDKLARLLGSSLAQGVDATARPRDRLDMPSLLAQLADYAQSEPEQAAALLGDACTPLGVFEPRLCSESKGTRLSPDKLKQEARRVLTQVLERWSEQHPVFLLVDEIGRAS